MTILHFWFIIWLLLVSSNFFHELGHLLAFKRLGRSVEIRYKHIRRVKFKCCIGYPSDYEGLSTREILRVYLGGIFFGSLPIILGLWFNKYYAIVIPFYLLTCKSDLKNSWRLKWIKTS